MKLVTYLSPDPSRNLPNNGARRVGLRDGGPEAANGRIIDVPAALEWLGTRPGSPPPRDARNPEDVLSIVRNASGFLPSLERIIASFRRGELPSSLILPEPEVRLLAPVPRPTSMRDGYAFRQHVEAARRNRGVPMIPEFDHFPIYYYTNHLSVTGPGELRVPKLALEKLDFELEVAIVIGKEGRDIPASRADEHVFGYMIMNDWSARALQMEEMKLNLGPAKGKDFATSLGPYLVTRDELGGRAIPGQRGERHDLRMKAFVNGKQVSDGNLKDISWTFAQIIERVSYGVTLYPGEVIGSGTVGTGCFLELNGSKITDDQWLKPGDRCVLEVEGLGRLENTIAAETEEAAG